jgi:hypothetical protein
MANYNSSHTGAEIDSAVGRTKSTAVTAGTVAASSAVVVDANKDISGFRNVTLTGQIQAATINLTGDTTIGDGDTDNITINADVNSNIIPNTDNTFDLGSASKQWKDLYVNGIGYIDQLGTDGDPIAIYASSGEIDGTAIGSESASTGAFTTISASSTATFNGTVDINNTSDFGSNAMTNVNIDSGTIDGVTINSSAIGAGGANTGAFTTLTASGNATFTGDVIIDADDKALVLGADQDASIWATDVGNVYIGSGQDLTLSSSDTEGWFNFKVGTSAESFLNIVGGEGGVSSLYMTADQADDNADRWRLQSDTSGNFTISTFSSGSYASAISINSSGNVGIGHSSAVDTDKLYVTDGASAYAGANRMMQLKRNATNGDDTSSFASMLIGNNSNGFVIGYGGTTDRFRFLDGSGTERVTIVNGGNVGIGTSSPNTALHLKFTDNTTNATDNSSLTHSSGIYINNESTTNEAHSSVGFRTNNLDGSLSMIYGGSANQGRMSVNMEGAERLVVTHDGNVGIGTTSPAVRGEIKNAASGVPATSGTTQTNGVLRLSSTATTGIIDIGMNGSAPWIQATDSGGLNNNYNLLLNPNGGNVGIGTTSPDGLLHAKVTTNTSETIRLQNDDTLSTLGVSSDGYSFLTYQTALHIVPWDGSTWGGTKVIVDANGKVGIGTTSPSDYSTSADNLVVYDANHAGITIASPTNKSGNLFFADGTSGDAEYRGFIQYDHGNNVTDAMMIGTAGAERMRITSVGDVMLGNQTMTDHTYQTLGVRGDSSSGVTSITLLSSASNTSQRSWAITSNYSAHGNLDFKYSSDRDGTPFTNTAMVITSGGQVLFGKTSTSGALAGARISTSSSEFTVLDGTVVYFNRQNTDGTIIDLRQGDAQEGTISVSGSTVSYNGFSGNHESSGIPTNTAIGTVVSTIDELDVYPNTDSKTGEAHSKAGETRADHAKIKVSDSVGDKRVYGVLSSFNKDNKPIVASVGIGSVKVTGACAGGDLLESNGDGTAKVQDDDIIRSKTIGKVTIGDSDTGVKLVSCVLYCG